MLTAHTLYDDDERDDVLSIDLDFGPFDDVSFVLDEGERELEKWMLRRGRPWDPQPELARDARPPKAWHPAPGGDQPA